MKLRSIVKDKRGQTIIGILFIIGLLAILLLIGFIVGIGSSVTNYVADEVMPELTGLGTIGNANVSEYASYTLNPLNSLIQSFTWLSGVLYVIVLLASLGIAFSMRSNPNGWLIGFYFMLVVVLVVLAIFMSNMYQDFYQDNSELGTRMQEHGLLSYMILYAPMIYAIIGFVTGIIIFSGRQEENFV